LASLTLGSPCGRPNRLRRFVEPGLLSVGGSNYSRRAMEIGKRQLNFLRKMRARTDSNRRPPGSKLEGTEKLKILTIASS
jgi:hypothetical protein